MKLTQDWKGNLSNMTPIMATSCSEEGETFNIKGTLSNSYSYRFPLSAVTINFLIPYRQIAMCC